MKIVVPFYPLYVSTEKEDYFKICADVTGGEIIAVNRVNIITLIRNIIGQNVHGHGRGFPFPQLSCFFGKKSVYTFHNNFIGQRWYAKILRRFIFNHYTAIIVHSEYAKNNYIKQGIKPEKIKILPNPIDYNYFSNPKGGSKFRMKFGLKKGEPIALTVGTSYFKNPDIIIKACNLVGIKLVIVGFIDKRETRKYPGVIPSGKIFLNSNNVILTGRLSKEELLSAYDSATVYINSSDSDGENFGISVYEAAAAGVPLCLPDYGTFDIFNGCALFHNNHNPEQLALNIEKYLNNKELCKTNSEKAKKIASQFDYSIVRSQFEQFYKEIGII